MGAADLQFKSRFMEIPVAGIPAGFSARKKWKFMGKQVRRNVGNFNNQGSAGIYLIKSKLAAEGRDLR